MLSSEERGSGNGNMGNWHHGMETWEIEILGWESETC